LRETHASFPSAHIDQPVITRTTLDFACTISYSSCSAFFRRNRACSWEMLSRRGRAPAPRA
jgi:hypothetical protein